MTVDEPRARLDLRLPLVMVSGVILAAMAVAYLRRRAARGMHVALTVTIDRPVAEVFAFVSDARNALRWLPVAVERTKLTDGPIGTGTRFEGRDRIAGRIVAHNQEIIGFEPDRRLTTRITGPGTAVYDILFDALDGATRLTIDVAGRSNGVDRWLDLVPESLMTRGYEQAYVRLKELLERGGAELVAIPIEPETAAIRTSTKADTAE